MKVYNHDLIILRTGLAGLLPFCGRIKEIVADSMPGTPSKAQIFWRTRTWWISSSMKCQKRFCIWITGEFPGPGGQTDASHSDRLAGIRIPGLPSLQTRQACPKEVDPTLGIQLLKRSLVLDSFGFGKKKSSVMKAIVEFAPPRTVDQ
jgi:hypothetical protein